MLTVSYGIELRHTAAKVNAVAPSYTATDLNGRRDARTVEVGARIVGTAWVGEDEPTASFVSEGRPDHLDGAVVPR